jgi:putative ABC transport system permease protein
MFHAAHHFETLWLAFRILLFKRSRLLLTVSGIAVAFFLSAAQIGLLVGWCNMLTAIVRHTGADVWVMAEQTPAFDYGTPIPEHRVYQVRNVDGIEWAQNLFLDFSLLHRPDGRRVQIELVGLDDDSAGGPWQMRVGDKQCVHQPDTIILDELFLKMLGVATVGDEVEINGKRAVVGGISTQVRTFTASPFVFTSTKSAVHFDPNYQEGEVTYVVARCANGVTPEQARDAVAREVPSIEALTSDQFARRTIDFWMLETGAGITVVITAVLGLVISSVIISQTLYAITQEHLSDYAALAALGFRQRRLVLIVLLQSLLLGALGISAASGLFFYAAKASATSPVPLETTPLVYSALILVSLLCCLLASFLSVRAILRIDPIMVFKV